MRLIDADALIKFLDIGHLRAPTTKCFSECDICNIIDNAPTVDAIDIVEIVRCKDCKYHNGETKGCTRNPSVEKWENDDYCSYGERIEK